MVDQKCPKCFKSANSKSGSITQWISVCRCHRLNDLEPVENLPSSADVLRCGKCAKSLRKGRSGSLTQWIFKHDLCCCEGQNLPRLVSAASKTNEPSPESSKEAEGESELTLEDEKFPHDRYKPLAVLGSGANGIVYLSRDRLLAKRVAVKVLRVIERERLLSFQNEARTASRLSHPHITKVLDFGCTPEGTPFMVMEYVEGLTLEHLIEQEQGLSADLAVLILIRIAEALEYAHNSNVLHCDLKPGNILIHKSDLGMHPYLIDFGVAKLKPLQTATTYNGTTIVGTPSYMSPDQARGASYDRRSDIYSFGCIMFETLTGRKLFEADSALELLALHANNPPTSILNYLEATPKTKALSQIIEICLAKDPIERFQTAKDLVNALQAVQNQSSLNEESSDPEPFRYRTNYLVWSFLILVLFVVPIMCALLFFQTDKQGIRLTDDFITTHGDAGYVFNSSSNRSIDRQPIRSFFQARATGSACSAAFETDSSLAELVHSNPLLSELWIELSRVTPRGLMSLRKLKKLEALRLKDERLMSVEHLAEISKLEGLVLLYLEPDQKSFDLRGIEKLRGTKLRELAVFDQPTFTGEVLTNISKITELQKLRVHNCGGFSKLNVGDLARLRQLSHLELVGCDLSDQTLRDISQLKNLNTIYLNRSPISDASLEWLSKSKSLRYVNLAGCTNLTVSGLKKYRMKSKTTGEQGLESGFGGND